MSIYTKSKIFIASLKMDKDIKKWSAKMGISESEFMRTAIDEKIVLMRAQSKKAGR